MYIIMYSYVNRIILTYNRARVNVDIKRWIQFNEKNGNIEQLNIHKPILLQTSLFTCIRFYKMYKSERSQGAFSSLL